MNIAAIFIRRPIMTTLVMVAILLFGILGYRSLPVNDLPNVDFPTIQVSASLPGANPDTIASAVATPLEKQFSTIACVDSMTSTSGVGATNITLQFDLNRNIDGAAQDVQGAISSASPQLPPNMPSPPTARKVNPADQPIYFIAVGSPTLPLYTVDQYAESMLAQRISMVKGVARVQVFGSQKYAVRIELDPRAMSSRQLGIDEVTNAIQNANVNLPTGTLSGEHQAYNVQANGQLNQASLYRPLIVAYRNGSPVRLDEIGNVLDGVQNNKIYNVVDDERALVLAIQRQPGTNTIEVVDGVKALLPQFQAIMPASIYLKPLYDRSLAIRGSVDDVKFTLFLAIILVVMVIFLFLRNISATLIPSIALPMSIVGTFAVMYELNYTVDNLSLMALTLSVGFVVDDAIVMLENIVRHMEWGEGVMDAAMKGSREIGFTILSMTMSLVAVFIPVLFMGGIIGRLLHEFAVVIMAAILVSGFVSLTLTPMLCSRFLRSQHGVKHGWMYSTMERFFDRLLRGYDRSLQWSLRHRLTVMSVAGIIFVATAWQFVGIPKGFLPDVDSSQLRISTEASQGISFDAMKAHQKEISDIISRESEPPQLFRQPGWAGRYDQRGVRVRSSEGTAGSSQSSQQENAGSGAQVWKDSRTWQPAARSRAFVYPPPGRQRCYGRTSPQVCSRSWDQCVYAEPTTDSIGRSPVKISVSIYVAEPGHGGTLPGSRQISGQGRSASGDHGRDYRYADRQSAGEREHRPRQGGSTWRQRATGGECPLFSLRAAADQHHLHAKRRILGRIATPGSISARPHSSCPALYPVKHRKPGPAECHRQPYN